MSCPARAWTAPVWSTFSLMHARGIRWPWFASIGSDARSPSFATVEKLRAQGVALLSLEEKIDTSSAAGELIFHVFGAIAHLERRLISERTKDGIAAARAKGKRPGRQPLDMTRVDAAIKLVDARMRGLVIHLLGSERCTNEGVASELGLHARTMHRRLCSEGTSFQRVKNQVRRDLLIHYLDQTDFPIAQISERLGFAEQSAMTRFCRQCLATSPTDRRAGTRSSN